MSTDPRSKVVNKIPSLSFCSGMDSWGDLVRHHASAVGFALRGALCGPSTGVCVVVTGASDRGFVTHRGPIGNLHLAASTAANTAAAATRLCPEEMLASLGPGAHFHVAGYFNMPGLWGAPLAALLAQARQKGGTTSLNPQVVRGLGSTPRWCGA